MNLPPNAKRTRYAWLLHGEKPVKKTKKRSRSEADAALRPEMAAEEAGGDPVDPAIIQATTEELSQVQSHHPPMTPNGYPQPPMYISPYRQVSESGGLVISGHGLDSNGETGRHLSPEGSRSMSVPPHG